MAPTITGLRPEEGAPDRVTVEVDGEPLAVVSVRALERLCLATGDEVNREALSGEIERAEVEIVMDRALQLLSYRARTREELRRRLGGEGYAEERVAAALRRLEETGLVNDGAYCAAFIRGRLAAHPEGVRVMVEALVRRGIARERALEAVRRVLEEEGVSEGDLLDRAARRKLRSLVRQPRTVARRRLFDHLARRGFALDDIRRFVEASLPPTG